jgi:membrane protein EpsK
MQSKHSAKSRLILNMASNVVFVLVNIIIGLWLTPYFIKYLGVEVYGMIPLSNSIVAIFTLFTMAITNSVSRFVSIHYDKDELEQCNLYFNSAITSLIAICVISLLPIIILSVYFSKIFHVPVGYEVSTGQFYFLVMLSSLVSAISGPFMVSTFITHRFDLDNLVQITGQLLRVIVIVLCFSYLSASLLYIGYSYCVMSGFLMIGAYLLSRKLTPQLKVRLKMFSWKAVSEMAIMSIWLTINQIGIFLYLGSGIIIINLFFGAEQCGRYSAVAQFIALFSTLAGTVSKVFSPIAYEYIAHDNLNGLSIQIGRSVKFMGLIMGLPIGILCGLATPILTRWLGHEFSDLGPLVWLLIVPLIVTVSVRPVASIYMGLDKVKIPALVTIGMGVLNVVLSIILVQYTHMGIYAVGWSLLLCFAGMNLFFTPIYAAQIIDRPKATFIKEIIPGLLIMAILLLFGLWLSWRYDLASIGGLLIASAAIFAVYALLCYGIFLSK